jgi:hypothetical protein
VVWTLGCWLRILISVSSSTTSTTTPTILLPSSSSASTCSTAVWIAHCRSGMFSSHYFYYFLYPFPTLLLSSHLTAGICLFSFLLLVHFFFLSLSRFYLWLGFLVWFGLVWFGFLVRVRFFSFWFGLVFSLVALSLSRDLWVGFVSLHKVLCAVLWGCEMWCEMWRCGGVV